MTKSLSSKYGKKSLNTEIMSAPDPLRTALGGTLQKTAATTSDLVQKKNCAEYYKCYITEGFK